MRRAPVMTHFVGGDQVRNSLQDRRSKIDGCGEPSVEELSDARLGVFITATAGKREHPYEHSLQGRRCT